MSGSRVARTAAAERTIGRLLIVMTYVAVALLVVGVVLLAAAGISPLSGGPPFDPAAIPAELAAATPAGFLWLGLMAVIATPIVRVIGAAVAYGSTGEWTMVAISAAILVVIAIGIAIALAATA